MEDTTKKINGHSLLRKKKLQDMYANVSQQMYARNRELAETNKTLSLLKTIDALVLESHASLKVVCQHITDAIAQATDYPFVGLLTRASNSEDEMRLFGWSGKDWLGGNKPEALNLPIHLKTYQDWLENPSVTSTISIKDVQPSQIAENLHLKTSDVERIFQAVPIKSVLIVKLKVRRRIVGLLVVGFLVDKDEIAESDTVLLDSLGDSIGVALDNKLLFEQNQNVLKQLQESNNKLVALDEAKDDFVSMASHQLRTPLTAIKGNISMVLDGDAGDVTEVQRKLLTQTSYSTQRMIYIIADLLNVSRLRTGKFVIDAEPVDLVKLITEEMDQLEFAAASKSLKLNFKKPDKITPILLDNAKTRQIIMNFVDNAIYYTPAGKNITIELTENKSTIDFRVIDEGIGVPKSEQHHLFTKFYRAANARKARPDGTGLGLFMAKKVIIAQGGAVIFDSKEGKGSTFGFMFSKNKLAVPENFEKKAPQAEFLS
ncbi:sensor histidine kinase [bacterium]|nr:sensor histidine kinase [bacterium]